MSPPGMRLCSPARPGSGGWRKEGGWGSLLRCCVTGCSSGAVACGSLWGFTGAAARHDRLGMQAFAAARCSSHGSWVRQDAGIIRMAAANVSSSSCPLARARQK